MVILFSAQFELELFDRQTEEEKQAYIKELGAQR